MPTSECNQTYLQQQYDHLRRDWDNYKTTIPHHRHCHLTADLPSSAADFDPKFFKISNKNLIFSPQCIAQSERMLLEALDNVKQAEATKIESPIRSGDCISLSSSLAWHGYDYEDSSSENDDDDLEEKDDLRKEKLEWIKRLRWFLIVMGAVAVGVLSSLLCGLVSGGGCGSVSESYVNKGDYKGLVLSLDNY